MRKLLIKFLVGLARRCLNGAMRVRKSGEAMEVVTVAVPAFSPQTVTMKSLMDIFLKHVTHNPHTPMFYSADDFSKFVEWADKNNLAVYGSPEPNINVRNKDGGK